MITIQDDFDEEDFKVCKQIEKDLIINSDDATLLIEDFIESNLNKAIPEKEEENNVEVQNLAF